MALCYTLSAANTRPALVEQHLARLPSAGPRPAVRLGSFPRQLQRSGGALEARRQHGLLLLPPGGLGSDAVGGWLDVAGFLSGGAANKTPYADLAYKIGSDVYADISGWHLYLRDLNAAPGVKMSDALAHQLGQLVANDGFNEASVAGVLARVPVELGKGKIQVALSDLLPPGCVKDLMRILQDFERDM